MLKCRKSYPGLHAAIVSKELFDEVQAKLARQNPKADCIYQLNFLAPRIKEAILDGIQPRGLTLTKLKDGIPYSWQEQYRLYGF